MIVEKKRRWKLILYFIDVANENMMCIQSAIFETRENEKGEYLLLLVFSPSSAVVLLDWVSVELGPVVEFLRGSNRASVW